MEGYWKDMKVSHSLGDLSSSIFASLGLADTPNPLAITKSESTRECLILVDGFGRNAYLEFASAVSRLSEFEYLQTLRATFPSTTATSLTSMGTGLSPGQHGMVGYTMRIPHSGTPERILNALKWDERVDPMIWQPHPTLFERATKYAIRVSHIASRRYADSGFTRAALRGAEYRAASSISELAAGAAAALTQPQSFAYLYINDVDEASHGAGYGSEKFKVALRKVDELLAAVIASVPAGTRIWLVSDHGMVNRTDYIVLGDGNSLLDGVDLLAGEPRMRYLYLPSERRERVKSQWSAELGDRVTIYERHEAIEDGLFGGPVATSILERIGDLIVVAGSGLVLVEPGRAAQQIAMVGHHGGLTDAECEIPLLALTK